MLVNKNTFNLKSTITEDWGSGHRIAIDLEALSNTDNWKIELSLPEDYKIDEIHGGELTQEGGKTYLSGANWNKSMTTGNKTEIILIVEEGNSTELAPIPTQFIFADSAINSAESNSILDASSSIVETWTGGYKLELDIVAELEANNWQLDFKTPFTIREFHGVELIDNGDGNYSISGKDDRVNLQAGQSIQPIFIIDDAEQQDLELDITGSSVDNFTAKSSIAETWTGGYKLELDIVAESEANNWQLDFNTPFTIREFYGVELIDRGNGNYSISGKDGLANLQAGQSIQPILIIDHAGQQDLELDITGSSNSIFEAEVAEVIETPEAVETVETVEEAEVIETPEAVEEAEVIETVEVVEEAEVVEVAEEAEVIETVEVVEVAEEAEVIETVEVVETDLATPLEEVGSEIENPASSTSIINETGESVAQTGKFAYGEALQKNFLFFEANRSGALPADNRLEWRSDSTTADGSDVGRDLNGGYFDAGDHIKFIQPMAFSNTMLAWSGADYKEAYARSGQLDELLEAVKWGTDWFLKAHEMDSAGDTERLWVQVGDKADHDHWVPAEQIAEFAPRPSFAIDRDNPGSDAAAGTASALASAAVLFRGTDDAYADELVKNAEALYEFAETYQGKYSDSVPAASPFYTSWSGYGDELALGGAWLHRATGNTEYLEKAENYFKSEIGNLGDWTYAADDHSYGAATLLAKDSSDPFFKEQTKTWLDTWVNGGGNVNYTEGGFAHRAKWASVPLNQSAAFSAEWYNDHVEANSSYSNFATEQTDYVLGDNPAGFSYVVGFGDNYAKRAHHRSSAGTAPMDSSDRENDHILYGAVVGGPGEVDDFSHSDRRDDWVTNEVGTGYNAPFAASAIQQYDNFGGDALSESDLDALIGVDANGVGF